MKIKDLEKQEKHLAIPLLCDQLAGANELKYLIVDMSSSSNSLSFPLQVGRALAKPRSTSPLLCPPPFCCSTSHRAFQLRKSAFANLASSLSSSSVWSSNFEAGSVPPSQACSPLIFVYSCSSAVQ